MNKWIQILQMSFWYHNDNFLNEGDIRGFETLLEHFKSSHINDNIESYTEPYC